MLATAFSCSAIS